MIDTMHLIYGAIFLAVLLGIEGLFMLLGGDSQRRAVNRRMGLRDKGHGTEEVLRKLRRQHATGADEGTGTALWGLQRMLVRAGVDLKASTLLGLMGIAAGLLWLVLAQGLNAEPITAAVVSLAVAVGAPMLILRLRGQARTRRFTNQLSDALDMAVRSLRAGHPVGAALKLISEQMPDPIGTEFGIVTDEMTYGLDLREALDNLARRVDAPEAHFMVVAINIQHQAGGNLAEVLAGLARVIRDRSKMVRKIRAISAEGRFSAWIISLMPFVVAGAITVLNPPFFAEVADDPLFLPGIAVLGVLLAVGIFTIFRMVTFKF